MTTATVKYLCLDCALRWYCGGGTLPVENITDCRHYKEENDDE